MSPARPLLPPLAVLGVAGALAIAIGTGHPASPVSAATPTGSDVGMVARSQGVVAAAAPLPHMAGALKALDRVKAGRAGAQASRSHQRTRLHPWVRPDIGPLSSPFGYRWGTLHPGIDLAGPEFSPIRAATDGCIESAAYDGGYGNRILIRDWDGTETLYGHMFAFVRTSGCVRAGQVIGREGSTGFSTGPHLHFEVHVNGAPIDPIPFLAARGVHI